MPRARELARRALEIDPDLAEAHAMLGIVAGQYDFDWGEAERRFGLAMARDTISPHLRQWNAYFNLLSLGRANEARAQMVRVIEEDPLSQMWQFAMSVTLQALGLDDEALAAARKSVELDPQFWLGWMLLGVLHAVNGRHAEALPCAEKAIAGGPFCPMSVGLMAGALENVDQPERAKPLIATLRTDPYGGPMGLAFHALVRGDIDSAVEWAGKAAEQRFTSLMTILVRPFEPRLRASAVWPALLKKVNL